MPSVLISSTGNICRLPCRPLLDPMTQPGVSPAVCCPAPKYQPFFTLVSPARRRRPFAAKGCAKCNVWPPPRTPICGAGRNWTSRCWKAPPAGLQVTGFRDPCPWKDGDTWYLGVGSGFNKIGGAVLLYTSPDGRNWSYLHPLAQGKWNGSSKINPVDTGEMWECPDFFPLGTSTCCSTPPSARCIGRWARSTRATSASTLKPRACSTTDPTTP